MAGVVTVAVVLGVVDVLGAALDLDDGEGPGGVVWEFVSTAAVGLAVFFLAPMLFRVLRLTEAPEPHRARRQAA